MRKIMIISICFMASFLLISCKKPTDQNEINNSNSPAPTQAIDNEISVEITGTGEEALPDIENAADSGNNTTAGDNPTIAPDVVATPGVTQGADFEPTPNPDGINEEEIIKNTNYVPGFTILKDQSFWVDLGKWGNVYFISASGEGEFGLDSLYMYLADRNSNILYEFPYFYGNGMMFCGTQAVAFKDVNKDGLKDVIVIAGYMTGVGPDGAKEFPVAGVYFQQGDAFISRPELDEEINSSGKNETIDMILEFLDRKGEL